MLRRAASAIPSPNLAADLWIRGRTHIHFKISVPLEVLRRERAADIVGIAQLAIIDTTHRHDCRIQQYVFKISVIDVQSAHSR